MDNLTPERTCCVCQSALHGRADKVFCNPTCKNTYHSAIRRKARTVASDTIRTLNKNYYLLCYLQGKQGYDFEISKTELIKLGFQFGFITGFVQTPFGVKQQLYEFSFYEKRNGVLRISLNEHQSEVAPYVYRRWKMTYEHQVQ